jgi:hypothetical protein
MQPRIAVVPGDLHRTATALHDELPRRPAPPPDVDGGWAATAALGLATGAVTDRLAGLVDGGTAIVSALRSAARAYELADDRPQDRWVAAGHELDAAPGRANREPAVRPAVTGADPAGPARP